MSELETRWDHPDPHILYTRVQADNIDGLHHTNNMVYVDWCQRVSWSHSLALGLDLAIYRALDRAMVITYSEYHYLRASREGDEVAVATWLVDWDRNLTLAREFQVVRVSDSVTLLRAKMRFACVEISSGRLRRMPPEFIQGYGRAVLGESPTP